MSIELSDYGRALEVFEADMGRAGEDVVSILLYGSVARGDISPGRSDLLDAYVFLDERVFDDRERFIAALEVMAGACERLALSGIPFHPFHYFGMDEIGRTPALYLPSWSSDSFSRALAGEDVRAQIGSSAASREAAAASFFEARRSMGHGLARYYNKEELTELDRERVMHGLVSLKKHITIMACLALGRWVEATRAVGELEEALPGLDTGVLKVVAARREVPPAHLDEGELRTLIREMLTFVEDLHDRLVARLRATPAGA
ncbi:MAG: hypothetical protein ABW250_02565 [Pyrinomonadaceae bacterium]